MNHRPIELHTLPPAWGLRTFTPFGLKLIAYLELARLPFTLVEEPNPTRGPTQKVPWIVDAGVSIGDSALIVDHLVRTHGDRVDGWLTTTERAQARALRRMVEEGLCFVLLYLRWVDDHAYQTATEELFATLPTPLRQLVPWLVRRRILRDLWGQGIGRLDRRAVIDIGRADLDALAALLGDRPFFLGDRACSADASIAALLAVLRYPPIANELRDHLFALPALEGYTRRMAELCFLLPVTERTLSDPRRATPQP